MSTLRGQRRRASRGETVDIEVQLTDQQIQIRDLAHRFAAEVMRPAGIALDRLHDPADVIAKNSILWDVFKKHTEVGLADVQSATAEMSPYDRARTQALVSEEMGWGDSGLAISLGVANFHKMFAMMSGRPSLIDRWVRNGQEEIGCWAVTEPDHGSDSLTVTEPHFSDPKVRANCIARRDGDFYVINGQKSGWVSNGTIATVAALFCTIDGDKGFRAAASPSSTSPSPGCRRASRRTSSASARSTRGRSSSTTCASRRIAWSSGRTPTPRSSRPS